MNKRLDCKMQNFSGQTKRWPKQPCFKGLFIYFFV